MFSTKFLVLLALCGVFYFKLTLCDDEKNESNNESSDESLNDTVPQDLYVIKTVIYEVGILTDAGNSTDNSTQTDDEVDISFFTPSNSTGIDLSNIPLPIQTNVSGVTVTGLVPGAELASLLSQNVTAPVLPTKQVTVTQNISTTNPDRGEEIISNLPKLLGLTKKNHTSD